MGCGICDMAMSASEVPVIGDRGIFFKREGAQQCLNLQENELES
jgi:hypothetical protein